MNSETAKLIHMEASQPPDMKKVFEEAMAVMDECDGVVILMQRRDSGMIWFAPDHMRFETIIFYLWQVLTSLGLIASGLRV